MRDLFSQDHNQDQGPEFENIPLQNLPIGIQDFEKLRADLYFETSFDFVSPLSALRFHRFWTGPQPSPG